MKKIQDITDTIHKWLEEKNAFRQEVSLITRGDKLYWLFMLARWGWEQRRKELKEKKEGMNATDISSLGSWLADLEEMTEALERELFPEKFVCTTCGKKATHYYDPYTEGTSRVLYCAKHKHKYARKF